jgi:fatty acid desaturase
MDPDKDLEKKINLYQDTLKDNPNVDMGMLMMNALQNEDKNRVSGKWKKWGYFISISAPPFGLLFALKFFFSDETDAKDVAWMCVTLTAVSVLAFVIIIKVMLAGSGTSVQQIEQIKPSDIYQLTQ